VEAWVSEAPPGLVCLVGTGGVLCGLALTVVGMYESVVGGRRRCLVGVGVSRRGCGV
jgi:hypothetical protein